MEPKGLLPCYMGGFLPPGMARRRVPDGGDGLNIYREQLQI